LGYGGTEPCPAKAQAAASMHAARTIVFLLLISLSKTLRQFCYMIPKMPCAVYNSTSYVRLPAKRADRAIMDRRTAVGATTRKCLAAQGAKSATSRIGDCPIWTI